MIRRLYDWTLALAAGKRAPTALGAVSFAESSFFPIPPDLLLIPMVLSRRERTWWFALLCTLASVAGGIAGYFIGALLFEQVALPVLEFYGYTGKIAEFKQVFNEWGWWFVFIAGLTPFPYKVITISSGAAAMALPGFILASLVSRGLRFFVVAGLLYFFGPSMQSFIEKRLGLVFSLVVVCLFGGFLLLKYL
ncbi:YqaA family protein [Polycladidibacter hongkongensis]|uniref:YqaA family protein n=1 Tax=Polycladidibacter hongkongensis TaxID=1647556 RepID=UPI0008362080|nr:YqaA family protein [Pseudovibrio hongkongensis]